MTDRLPHGTGQRTPTLSGCSSDTDGHARRVIVGFIVFRDVQTGKKYEFIANDWLAVKYGDGQVGEAMHY
ncbi:hypothetical protein E2C01_056802 [Portunus trituberculatus]|uniref:Uncharacterized protein n=1 Tax=Portunus trituberculatus TaxID=210409 RepID=A0A5B7GYE7_PORTR|nr:hypothetical protein [Portunus trituberculatus]